MKIDTKHENRETLLFLGSIFIFLILLDTVLQGLSIIFLLVILLLYIIVNAEIKIIIGKMNRILVVYLAYTIFITIRNYNTINVLNSVKQIILNIFIFIFVLIIVPRINLDKTLRYVRNSSLILCLFGLLEFIYKYPIVHKLISNLDLQYFADSVHTSNYRIVLFFIHPIILGVFLLFFWIILLYKPFKNFFVNSIAHLLILANIFGTKSRSSWLALFIIIIILVYNNRQFLRRKIRKKTFIQMYFFLMIFALANMLMGNPINNIITDIGQRVEGSLDAGEGHIIRIETLLNSVNYWLNGNEIALVFGNGQGFDKIFMKLFPIKKFGTYVWDEAIDNQYITLIHNFGIIGFSFIISNLIIAIKRLFSYNHTENGMIANLSLIVFYITMFFYESFGFYSCLLLYFFLTTISDLEASRKV